ncbi:Xaa-Pro peptidase family protein [Alphaproteobacteria bacterium]|nr:Xaa-Pro peptidase family protein [Alphaproteobacteria bacterium]
MANLDRKRAEILMRQVGIDALILLSPESFFYATGAKAGVATMWRKPGAVAVLVPCDANLPETAIVSDLFAKNFREVSHITDIKENPIWVETVNLDQADLNQSASSQVASAFDKIGRPDNFSRPTTFNPEVCYRYLTEAISKLGLNKSIIGFEASAISVFDYKLMREIFKVIKLRDASHMINKLKMVKTSREIDYLQQAVEIAERGMLAIKKSIYLGVTRNQLAETWQKAISKHPMADRLSGAWEYISVGKNPWGGNSAVTSGDLIKVDVGCLVEGYTSDSARTFVFGKSDRVKLEIYQALLSGFTAGADCLRPGVQLKEVYHTTLSAIRNSGFPGYTRGHFGHSLGAGLGSEQWPFISADEETVLEPGMVMAFECPWYIDGIGGMIIENQLLITEGGHEMMNKLSLELQEIS